MVGMKNQLSHIYLSLGDFLKPLAEHFSSPERFEYLFAQYGWDIILEEEDYKQIKGLLTFLEPLKDLLAEAEKLRQQVDEGQIPVQTLLDLGKKARKIINALRHVDTDEVQALFSPLNQPAFWKDIAKHLFDDLIISYLQSQLPVVYAFLRLFGTITHTHRTIAAPFRIPYHQHTLHWNKLPGLISNPIQTFQNHYGWSSETDSFLHESLMTNLQEALRTLKIPSRVLMPKASFRNNPAYNPIPDYSIENGVLDYYFPIFSAVDFIDLNFAEFGLSLLAIPQDGAGKPKGILFQPVVRGAAGQLIPITKNVSLSYQIQVVADGLVQLEIFPDKTQLSSETPELDTEFSLFSTFSGPHYLLGRADSTHIALSGFDLQFGLQGAVDDPEALIRFQTQDRKSGDAGLNVSMMLNESDAFVEEVVGQEALKVNIDAEISWSSKTGFRFGGSAGLSYQAVLNKQLGPIALTNLYLELLAQQGRENAGQGHIQFRTGFGIKGDIGPLNFLIDNVGFALDFLPYSAEEARQLPEPPLLGTVDLDFGFAPPRAVGFSIDARAVKGGGFLRLDHEKGEYVGFAELAVLNKFNVKAIALIHTKLPDKQPGYTFLMMITGEFNPIQLGMGFTLQGVGGIIGLHRGLNLDNIQAGVKNGQYDYLLFPEDPLAKLPAILTGLNHIMPIEKQHYAFGIMAKIGWGTPTVLEIKAGLIFEVPNWEIALIGVAKAEIKRKDKLLARLQVDFAMIFDPQKALFAFDASLSNSRLLSWTLTGDIALRIRGGSDPYFLLSAGGFHPDFKPPQGLRLPKMDRLRITMAAGNPKMHAQVFFALTSNTIQFGADAHASYSKWGIGFQADLGFAALIQFDPLYFKAAVWGGVSLDFFGLTFGLDLKGTVEGPRPLVFNLYVTFKIWIWSKTVRVPEIRIGKADSSKLEEIAVAPILLEQLTDERNWQLSLPPRVANMVSLKTLPDGTETGAKALRFHPLGDIVIKQERVPLNQTLQRFGHTRPSDYRRFELDFKEDASRVQAEQSFFAPAQYFDLEEEAVFNSRAYETYDSGIRIGAAEGFQGGAVAEKTIVMEEIILDVDKVVVTKSDQLEKPGNFMAYQVDNTIEKSTAGKAHWQRVVSKSNSRQFKRNQEAYLVIDSLVGMPATEKQENMSREEAQQLMQRLLKLNPGKEGILEVVPAYEIEMDSVKA